MLEIVIKAVLSALFNLLTERIDQWQRDRLNIEKGKSEVIETQNEATVKKQDEMAEVSVNPSTPDTVVDSMRRGDF